MIKKIETENAPKAIGPYSQAVVSGKTIYVSGQLPIDPKTGKFPEGDIRVLTRQVLSNLENILHTAGTSLEHVVRADIFLKDLNDFAAVNEEYGKKFHYPVKPARQTIQVARLPLDAPVEISCIAIIP